MNSKVNNNRIATLQDAQGRLHEVTDFPFIIGRQADAHLSIAGASVSRRHAQIDLEQGRYRLKDLASTNGTWVNDYKIDQVLLDDQDSIRFGDETLTFALMHPSHARVVASTRLDDALSARRHSSLELDNAVAIETLSEDRNWFIWIVALVILVAMLASAYLIFEIRGGNLGLANDAGSSTQPSLNTQNPNPDQTVQDTDQLDEKQEALDAFNNAAVAPMPDNGPPVQKNESIVPQQQNQEQAQARLQEILKEAGSAEFQQNQNNNQEVNSNQELINDTVDDEPNGGEAVAPDANADDWPEWPSAVNKAPAEEPIAQSSQAKKKLPSKPTPSGSTTASGSTAAKVVSKQSVSKQNAIVKNVPANTSDPVKLYLSGKAPEAIKILNQKIAATADMNSKADLMTQKQAIEALYQQYQAGQKAFAAEDENQAFQTWMSFLDKEKALMVNMKQSAGTARSVYANEVAKSVGKAFFDRAEAAKASKDFGLAYRYWMLAAKFADIDEARIRANTIEQHAQQLYQQGLTMETQNPPEALRLWQEVLKILPSEHNLYTKANAKLAWVQRNGEVAPADAS